MDFERKKKDYLQPETTIILLWSPNEFMQTASLRNSTLHQFDDSNDIDDPDQSSENLGDGWNGNNGWI